MTRSDGDDYNYTCSHEGLLLPLFSEFTWSIEVRAFLYLLGMLYCFLGVAIVADIFMCSIEKITSKTRTITKEIDGITETIEVKVWNDTVANLTLMALGSSAPEIILSSYEIIGDNFESGNLGPGSVVGAAGFNLLVITAVCVLAIPDGEIRRIRLIKVFAVTAFFGIFAYLWLVFILMFTSPDVIELWEACLTLAFFPIMVLTAYIADKNLFIGKSSTKDSYAFDNSSPDGNVDRISIMNMIKIIQEHPDLTEADAATIAAARMVNDQEHSRAWYRVEATRELTGGRRSFPKLTVRQKEVYDEMSSAHEELSSIADGVDNADVPVVEFVRQHVAVLENAGILGIDIRRHGKRDVQVICRVETVDGTAKSVEDYISLNETVTFRPFEEVRTVFVTIVNDNQWEPEESFFVKLSVDESDVDKPILGNKNQMEITIIDDDDPGMIQFQRQEMTVKCSSKLAGVTLLRRNGADGLVTVRWRMVEIDTLTGISNLICEGELIFQHGESQRDIELPITGDYGILEDTHLEIELLDTTGGASIGEMKKIAVTITDDQDRSGIFQRMMSLTQSNVEHLSITTNTWAEQMKNALTVNGGDVENATTGDYFMHFLTFGWKVFFALIPPTVYAGGWLTFFIALAMIGLLTAVVGDLASIFGCLVGLKDSVTAITFVALGTSLPDLFASKAAARQDKFADNAVGNVNGSNAVNVFLGLGISWLIATIYWSSKGKPFVVHAGTLAFSVSVYSACGIFCILLLMARRYIPIFGRAELGGNKTLARVTCFILISLWLFYILISSFQAYGYITA